MPFLVNSSWRASRSYLSTDFDRYSSIHSCLVCGFNACKKALIRGYFFPKAAATETTRKTLPLADSCPPEATPRKRDY